MYLKTKDAVKQHFMNQISKLPSETAYLRTEHKVSILLVESTSSHGHGALTPYLVGEGRLVSCTASKPLDPLCVSIASGQKGIQEFGWGSTSSDSCLHLVTPAPAIVPPQTLHHKQESRGKSFILRVPCPRLLPPSVRFKREAWCSHFQHSYFQLPPSDPSPASWTSLCLLSLFTSVITRSPIFPGLPLFPAF